MLIENMMYFALGALVSGLLALIILPAVWKRAVRLTKRRMEAATPITMAEFRADKDQLRAEFALSTRRLEMTVETLRNRLAEQLADVNQKRSDLGGLKSERDTHLAIIKEFEAREPVLRARLAELERDNTDLAQRLRMRERSSDEREAELGKFRQAASETRADEATTQLETENRSAAEARIARAEIQLNALLTETGPLNESEKEQSLADQLGTEADVEKLRHQVEAVESAIMADWNNDRVDQTRLRASLNDIAASVGVLVNPQAKASLQSQDKEESLFDRVQRYADDEETIEALSTPPSKPERSGKVADRMAAIREIQGI